MLVLALMEQFTLVMAGENPSLGVTPMAMCTLATVGEKLILAVIKTVMFIPATAGAKPLLVAIEMDVYIPAMVGEKPRLGPMTVSMVGPLPLRYCFLLTSKAMRDSFLYIFCDSFFLCIRSQIE